MSNTYTMEHETDKGSEIMSSPTPTEVLSNLECCDHIPSPAQEPTKPKSSEVMKIPTPAEVICSPESEVLNNPESSSDQIPSAAEEALTKQESSSSVESKIPSSSIAAEAPTKQESSSVESEIHSPSIAAEATNTRRITTNSSSLKGGNPNNPKKRRLSDNKGASSRPVMTKRPRRFTPPIGNARRPIMLFRDSDMQHTHGSVRREEMPCDLYEKEYRANYGPQGRRPIHYGDVYEREHLPNPANYTAGAARHELRPLALVDLYGRDPRYNRDYHQRGEQVPVRAYFDPMQENRGPHDRGDSRQWGHDQAAVNDRMGILGKAPLSYIRPQTCQQVSKTVAQHPPNYAYSLFASASYSSYR